MYLKKEPFTSEALLTELAALPVEQKKEGIYLRADKNVPCAWRGDLDHGGHPPGGV